MTTDRKMLWAGRILSGVFIIFMIFDVAIKLARLKVVADTLVALGWPAKAGLLIGLIEAVALILYIIPATSILGAVLTTGIMGGAIATHWRLGNPLFSHTLFGIYLGCMAWGGLWLRDPDLRAILPIRR